MAEVYSLVYMSVLETDLQTSVIGITSGIPM